MNGSAAAIGALLLLTAATVSAQDRLAMSYVPGYPLPGRSSASVSLEVTRSPASPRQEDAEIDRFFASVQGVLTEYKVTRKWQLVRPDSPYVRMTITIADARWELASSLPPAPIATTLRVDELDSEARHQVALEKIRRLVHEYVQARSPR